MPYEANLEASEHAEARQALCNSEERLRLALHAGWMAQFDWDIERDEVAWSSGHQAIFGADLNSKAPSGGWHDHIHLDDWHIVDTCLQNAREHAAPICCEYRIRHQDDEERWVELRGVLLAISDGRPERMSGFLIAATERKQAERRQLVLMAELDHRVKNILANVCAIAHQTRATASSVDGYIDDLEGRIHALAIAHSLRSEAHGQGADLATLIKREFGSFACLSPERFAIAGNDVTLKPFAAQTLILAIHELAINATKYGALSSPHGGIAIEWATGGDGETSTLVLEWREHDGPAVTPPARAGFGTSVIVEFLKTDLDAWVTWSFPEEGVVCLIELPACHVLDAPAHDGKSADGPQALTAAGWRPRTAPDQRRILVVEDSWLIFLEITAALTDSGFEPIGPATSVAAATELLDAGSIDAVILDLNLDGEMTLPIAERLEAERIPYLLATGYDPASILPAHLKNSRSVRKPFLRNELIGGLLDVLGA